MYANSEQVIRAKHRIFEMFPVTLAQGCRAIQQAGGVAEYWLLDCEASGVRGYVEYLHIIGRSDKSQINVTFPVPPGSIKRLSELMKD